MQDTLASLLREHGAIVIGGVTLLESMGVPLPGESAVVAAALYAAATHDIGIVSLVAAAATGAIIGDNIGYLIGRWTGFQMIARFGRRVGLTKPRIKLGRYLFWRHGNAMVFFGRFVAVLRSCTALLAGANHMAWWRFLVANALGGSLWASLYGFGPFLLGEEVQRLERPLAIGLGGLALTVAGTIIVLLRRHKVRLQAEAETAFPD